MANTYIPIATTVVGSSGTSYIEFTNIPQTYTDLVIMASLRDTDAVTGADVFVRYNGNTSNFTNRRVYGLGSAVFTSNSADRWIAATNGGNSSATTFGNFFVYIPNYTSSNYKSSLSDCSVENNAIRGDNYMIATLWSNTSAITSIRLDSQATYTQYSTATLYGIKNS